jgi:hypothetical protein
MRLSHLLPAALLVAAGLTPASAADLATIDRTLPHEPAYTHRRPKYCLVAFGPEARTLVWLVRDGNTLHVLDSPDGKAPKRWRQVHSPHGSFALGDVWAEGGLVRYKNLRYVRSYPDARLAVEVGGKRQFAGWDRSGSLAFAASPEQAPVVHFDGPLTLDLYAEQEPLRTGQWTELTAVVGTPGVGPGTFAHFLCDAYPKGAWPTAVVEFPAQGGGPPLVVKVRLKEE